MKNIGQYAKFIVAILGAVMSSLSAYYGTTHWFTVVSAAVTAIAIYLVPNQTPQK